MDELACELGLDPVELRLRNYAEVHPQTGRPWSSKALRECYQRGAERFGWARRTPEVALDERRPVAGRLRDGQHHLRGYQAPCQVRVSLGLDGTAHVGAATRPGPRYLHGHDPVSADARACPRPGPVEIGDSTCRRRRSRADPEWRCRSAPRSTTAPASC